MNERHDASDPADPLHSRVVYLAILLLPVAYGLLYLSSLSSEQASLPTSVANAVSTEAGKGPIVPLPAAVGVDGRKADLGQVLFSETRLSGTGDVSCVTCHDIDQGGADGRRTPTGSGGQKVSFNAPSIFNAGFNLAQSWYGQNPTLESQIDSHIADDAIMASSWPRIVDELALVEGYEERFASLYDQGMTASTIRDAIAGYVRTLITSNARFDQHLRGRDDVLDAAEKEGYRLFTVVGCVACHQGRNLGGNLYQKLGLIHAYEAAPNAEPAHRGRFNITGAENDLQVFKVPSLRNVALTAPYFHDGSIDRLEDAVSLMAYHQLGRVLTEAEVSSIVAFLKTLTGDRPS